jgi:hypothetical protein
MSIEGVVQDEKDKIAVKCFERIKKMYENDYSDNYESENEWEPKPHIEKL